MSVKTVEFEGTETARAQKLTTLELALVSVTLVIAILLRIYGLDWGLPSQARVHSYHPDEITVIGPTLHMNIFAGEMNPHFFNYGSLFLYLVYFARLFAEGYGWLDLTPFFKAFASGSWLAVLGSLPAVTEFAKLHLLARMLSVLFGVATVLLVFFWVRKLAGLWAAFAGAILLATFPMHVQHSHFATVDIPLTFLTTLSLYLASSAESARRFVLAAFVAGLATAVKYSVAPALLLTLLVLVVSWARSLGRLVLVTRVVTVTVAMGVSFLLGCPYSVISFQEFWRDFYWETFVHSRIGHGYVFAETGNGHWFHLTVNLPAAVGVPAILLALLGVLPFGSQIATDEVKLDNFKRRTLVATILFSLAYFVPLGFAQVRFARYLMPLLPILALWASLVWTKLKWRRLWQLGSIVTAIYTLLCGIAVTSLFAPPDPRDEAAAFITERNLGERPLTIALHDLPWFYTPPICPINGGKKTERDFVAWQVTAPFKLVLIQFDLNTLSDSDALLFVASDFEYGDPLRLKLGDVVRIYKWLYLHSREVKVFRKEPRLPWRDEPFRWYFRPLPHDMRYVNPIVKVFVLR
ncbi:MAG: ArnT family glycosyltransferase [Candidatus Fervidibacter sp.]|uniref:ArnT family glycosyltransferase n=1 Tax=Candidatus Fervidibacter sp. TaxID=3100871 RepID=UPI00404995E8